MKTWGQIDSDLDFFLEDTSRQSYPEVTRLAAFTRACEYFATTHTAPFKSVTVSATAYGDGTLVSWPQDFLELPEGGVADEDGYHLEPLQVVPGDGKPSSGYIAMGDGLYLPGAQSVVRLWYFAHYTAVENSSTEINLPAWAEWAVLNLAMAYLLYPAMMNQQMLRQFQTRREAGAPEDNPPREQAKFLMGVYQDIVGRVRPQDRGLAFTPGPMR